MKEAVKEQVEAEIKDWEYLENLPAEWHGFKFQRLMKVKGDTYELFRYENPMAHRSLTAYFHEETKEYKVLETVGLSEFCRLELITPSFATFNKLLAKHFPPLLENLARFNPNSIGSLVKAKGIGEWPYGQSLPENLEGFTLFIKPAEPLPITNGSYVIIDYADFSLASNFVIYYNMYRDEFCGEARIRRIPDVNYDFDSATLNELAKKLERHLAPRLREVRRRAEDFSPQ